MPCSFEFTSELQDNVAAGERRCSSNAFSADQQLCCRVAAVLRHSKDKVGMWRILMQDDDGVQDEYGRLLWLLRIVD